MLIYEIYLQSDIYPAEYPSRILELCIAFPPTVNMKRHHRARIVSIFIFKFTGKLSMTHAIKFHVSIWMKSRSFSCLNTSQKIVVSYVHMKQLLKDPYLYHERNVVPLEPNSVRVGKNFARDVWKFLKQKTFLLKFYLRISSCSRHR